MRGARVITRPSRLIWIVCAALMMAAEARAQTAADLFDDARLHTLELTVHSRDWADLLAAQGHDQHYPADVTWNGERVRNVGIQARGMGSRSNDKPGLELDFNHYAKDQRLVGLRSLVLDNLVTDPSMMREVLAMSLLRRVGVPAPRESFARVFVNGEYFGLYAMVEVVNSEFAAAAFGGTGLLFEYRWTQAYYETFPGENLETYAANWAPRGTGTQSLDTLYDPVREMFRAITETPDGAFAGVNRWLDLQGAVRILAADAFMAELDGLAGYDGMNNVYLYRIGEQAHVIPWDKDHAFWAATAPVLAYADEHLLMVRLLADPELRAAFFDAVDATATAAATESWLEAETGRYYALIRDAALTDPLKPSSNEDFDAAVATLADFARTRPAFVQSETRRLR